MAAFCRISGLMYADWVAYYILWMIMIYLIDVWEIEFTQAAAIINVWRGLVLVLPLVFQYLASTFLANFSVLFLTTFSYSTGLGLLWMSTPPVLGNKTTRKCTEYKPECIGDLQKQLFYAALVLIAVGIAGHVGPLVSFLVDQVPSVITGLAESVEQDKCCMVVGPMLGNFMIIFLIPVVGYSVSAFVKSWAVQFGLCAIFALVALLVFLSGVCLYKYVLPQGSALTVIFRVIVASLSKMFCKLPQDVSELYEKGNNNNALLPHTKGLRCLDKAAIIRSQPALEKQEQQKWRLCRVTEVEATKMGIRLLPLYTTFIICGVISSLGRTYFLAQATTLNPKLGRIKVPLIFFLWFYGLSFSYISLNILHITLKVGRIIFRPIDRYFSLIALGMSMVFSFLCCVVAAVVETRRLKTVSTHGLLNKPNDTIPMTVFWLLPQFALLGVFEGIYTFAVSSLITHLAPPSMSRYFHLLRTSVMGFGYFGSIISVYAVGKVSTNVSGTNWFQTTLNRSRLDNYYWVLAALSGANLVVYIVVAWFIRNKGPTTGLTLGVTPENGENQDNMFNQFGFHYQTSYEYSSYSSYTSNSNGTSTTYSRMTQSYTAYF